MNKSEMTLVQKRFLGGYGIRAESLNKKTARSIISFIKKGNEAESGTTETNRAEDFRRTQEAWLGKEVTFKSGKTGIVTNILPRTKHWIFNLRRNLARTNQLDKKVEPFYAFVTFPDKTHSNISLSTLNLHLTLNLQLTLTLHPD